VLDDVRMVEGLSDFDLALNLVNYVVLSQSLFVQDFDGHFVPSDFMVGNWAISQVTYA